jgi:predicted sulfurtransferase
MVMSHGINTGISQHEINENALKTSIMHNTGSKQIAINYKWNKEQLYQSINYSSKWNSEIMNYGLHSTAYPQLKISKFERILLVFYSPIPWEKKIRQTNIFVEKLIKTSNLKNVQNKFYKIGYKWT